MYVYGSDVADVGYSAEYENGIDVDDGADALDACVAVLFARHTTPQSSKLANNSQTYLYTFVCMYIWLRVEIGSRSDAQVSF